MAWTIILEDENKEAMSSLEEEFIFDENLDSSFKLLKYLDPYGDTSFESRKNIILTTVKKWLHLISLRFFLVANTNATSGFWVKGSWL